MILYTADLHFGHRSVIDFDHRPFSDVEEMDGALIKLWNERVSEKDHVYIIGDFAYRNEKGEEWYLRQLKGHKHLIIGNHEKRMLNNPAAMHYFESVDKMLHVTDNGTQICLCPVIRWRSGTVIIKDTPTYTDISIISATKHINLCGPERMH